VTLALVAGLTSMALAACIPTGPGIERISVSADGEQAELDSFHASVSRDGRYVVYVSTIQSTSRFGASHVYRKDRATGEVVLVSRDAAGAPLTGRNRFPSISADGSRVAFVRVVKDELGINDLPTVFVRDLALGTTVPVSVRSNGQASLGDDPAISSDGRFVAFTSTSALVSADTNGRRDVYVRDLTLATVRRASVAHGGGQLPEGADVPAVSGDGRFVAFRTVHNLVPADTDSDADLYVRDLVANTTTLISIAGPGTFAQPQADLSDDGRFVAFVSSQVGNGHRHAWVRDRTTGQLHLVSHALGSSAPSNNTVIDLSISRDGGHVGFSSAASNLVAGDTNNQLDVFVATVTGGDMTRVSVDAAGGQVNRTSQGGSVADGGATVAFQSESDALVAGDTNGETDIFVTRR
jgi:Tol biopolymer transport system component